MARAKGQTEVSPAMLEGFAAAKVLVEGLKRAGPKPAREKLQTALEGTKKFDIGGLEITDSPDDHTGLDFSTCPSLERTGDLSASKRQQRRPPFALQ